MSLVAGVLAVMLAVMLAGPALAKGWDVPAYTVSLRFSGTDDAFPGSPRTGPDQTLEPTMELASANKFGKNIKMGVSAVAGGNVQREFTRANYGWFGGGTSLRYLRTTYTLDAEYTPARNKFPSDPEEGGEYQGWQVKGAIRQALGSRLRLRAGAKFETEDFKSPLIKALGRDSRSLEWLVQANVAPVRTLDLRALGTIGHDESDSRKYRKDTRTFGLGTTWSDSLWRIDASTQSGVRQYPDAIAGDSNFERRDQWIDVMLRLSRRLTAGVAMWVGGDLVDQTSSRMDKAYLAHTIMFGLEWTGGGR
jgi:hypothetical protein